MKYKKITFQENQRRALQVLSYIAIPNDIALPVDPELIIRKLGYPLNVIPYLYKNFGVSGLVYKKNGNYSIGIDEYHYENQASSAIFTLGEELGHIFLHLAEASDIKTADEWIENLTEDPESHSYIESQARTFASNIILPATCFGKYMNNWMSQNSSRVVTSSVSCAEDLGWNIAQELSDDIDLSKHIIRIALERYPDRVIDTLWDTYK